MATFRHTPATCRGRMSCCCQQAPRPADLHQHGVADQADGQAFDLERFAGLHDDGGVVGVFGVQFDEVLVPLEALTTSCPLIPLNCTPSHWPARAN